MVSDMWHSVDDEEIENLEAKYLGKKPAPKNEEGLHREWFGLQMLALLLMHTLCESFCGCQQEKVNVDD